MWKPKQASAEVSCSADGSSWGDAVTHGKGDFKETGEKTKGNAIAFDVAKVCTGDEKCAARVRGVSNALYSVRAVLYSV